MQDFYIINIDARPVYYGTSYITSDSILFNFFIIIPIHIKIYQILYLNIDIYLGKKKLKSN